MCFLLLSTAIRVPMETPNVQIVRVEKPRALKDEHIGDRQPLFFEHDQASFPEILDRAVDMNRREASRFGNIVLGQR